MVRFISDPNGSTGKIFLNKRENETQAVKFKKAFLSSDKYFFNAKKGSTYEFIITEVPFNICDLSTTIPDVKTK